MFDERCRVKRDGEHTCRNRRDDVSGATSLIRLVDRAALDTLHERTFVHRDGWAGLLADHTLYWTDGA